MQKLPSGGLPGHVHIFDTRLNLGRIFLDDRRESGVIQFPETYEENDRIFATFPNGDVEKSPTDYRVENEEICYGQIVEKYNEQRGKTFQSIMQNWPRTGTKPFPVFNWAKERGVEIARFDVVAFTVNKDMSGRETAVNIRKAPRDKEYLGVRPIMGRLRKGSGDDGWLSGIVSSVQPYENIYFGKIKPADGSKPIDFFGPDYTKNYDRTAKIGDIVHYKVGKNPVKGTPQARFRPTVFDGDPWLIEYRDKFGKAACAVCQESTFSNFQQPTEGQMYLAYVRHNSSVSECTVEIKLASKSDAIAVLRNPDVPGVLKLDAIDFLIPLDLEYPETCRVEKLRAQKEQILSSLADSERTAGHLEAAFEAEKRAQAIVYRPQRLKEYGSLKQPWGDPARFLDNPAKPSRNEGKSWAAVEEIDAAAAQRLALAFAEGFAENGTAAQTPPLKAWNMNWTETAGMPRPVERSAWRQDWLERDNVPVKAEQGF